MARAGAYPGTVLVPDLWIERLMGSAEPAARWIALTGLAGLAPADPRVGAAHAAVLADPRTADLLDRLVPWEVENPVSGHQAPAYAPNLLTLLFDIGVRPEDDPRIAACLDEMLRRVGDGGRFEALGSYQGRTSWASLPCDHHAILDVLIRGGRGEDPAVRTGVDVLSAALTETPQGWGWQCLPDPRVGFRGPGRKADVCPQVTLEALRVYARLDPAVRPPGLGAALRTPLEVWRRRGVEQPYMFGHGRSFKEGKWPLTWYSAWEVVDTLGRFPRLWSGPDVVAEDARAMAELAACVRAYMLDGDGRVVPLSTYKGFVAQSFGRKGRPSDLGTALALRALRRVEPIAAEVAAVDVLSLPGSKGGGEQPRPPRLGSAREAHG